MSFGPGILHVVDAGEVRMRLLEDELSALHSGIAALDARMAQIRGWCVTVVSGILALAITQSLGDLILGAVLVVVTFWWVEAHSAALQRVMIRRLQALEAHFQGRDPLAALLDDKVSLPGMCAAFISPPSVQGWFGEMRFELRETWSEAKSPYRSLFYLLTAVAIAVMGGTILAGCPGFPL